MSAKSQYLADLVTFVELAIAAVVGYFFRYLTDLLVKLLPEINLGPITLSRLVQLILFLFLIVLLFKADGVFRIWMADKGWLDSDKPSS